MPIPWPDLRYQRFADRPRAFLSDLRASRLRELLDSREKPRRNGSSDRKTDKSPRKPKMSKLDALAERLNARLAGAKA